MTEHRKVDREESKKNLKTPAAGKMEATFHSENVHARIFSVSKKTPYHIIVQTVAPNLLIEIYRLESKTYDLANTNELYVIADFDYTGLFPAIESLFDSGKLVATVHDIDEHININLHIEASSSSQPSKSKLNTTIKLKIPPSAA